MKKSSKKSRKPSAATPPLAVSRQSTEDDPILEPIRRALQEAIQPDRWTLNALATHLGMPHSVLHRFTHGERKNLSADNLSRLARHFGLKLGRPTRGLTPPK